MAKPEIKSEADAFRQAFHERMHANHMYGLWELASQMTPHPQPKMIPHMWRWSTTESIRGISSGRAGRRRAARVAAFQSWSRWPLGDDQQPDRRRTDSLAG